MTCPQSRHFCYANENARNPLILVLREGLLFEWFLARRHNLGSARGRCPIYVRIATAFKYLRSQLFPVRQW